MSANATQVMSAGVSRSTCQVSARADSHREGPAETIQPSGNLPAERSELMIESLAMMAVQQAAPLRKSAMLHSRDHGAYIRRRRADSDEKIVARRNEKRSLIAPVISASSENTDPTCGASASNL